MHGLNCVFWANLTPSSLKGFTAFKMKCGMGLEDDARRAALMRSLIGWDSLLMMDANSVWGVNEAIENMTALAEFNPYWTGMLTQGVQRGPLGLTIP